MGKLHLSLPWAMPVSSLLMTTRETPALEGLLGMQCSKGCAVGFTALWLLLNTSQEKGQALQWGWQSPPAHVHQALNALGHGKDWGILSFHSDVLTHTPRKAVILECAPVANLFLFFLWLLNKPVLKAFVWPTTLCPVAELLCINRTDIFLSSVKGSLVASNPLPLQTLV